MELIEGALFIFFIVLNLWIYHSIFKVYYFNLSAGLGKELIGSMVVAVFETALVIKLGGIILVIVLVLAVICAVAALVLKFQNKGRDGQQAEEKTSTEKKTAAGQTTEKSQPAIASTTSVKKTGNKNQSNEGKKRTTVENTASDKKTTNKQNTVKKTKPVASSVSDEQQKNDSKKPTEDKEISSVGNPQMQFCPNCGKPVTVGKFCPNCGSKLELATTTEESKTQESVTESKEPEVIEQRTEQEPQMSEAIENGTKDSKEAEIAEYIKNNFTIDTKIDAVKYYRKMTDAGLKEAKDAVDEILKSDPA